MRDGSLKLSSALRFLKGKLIELEEVSCRSCGGTLMLKGQEGKKRTVSQAIIFDRGIRRRTKKSFE